MSNVVPMRAYTYVDWLDITIKTNKLRMARGQKPDDNAWVLWLRFFDPA